MTRSEKKLLAQIKKETVEFLKGTTGNELPDDMGVIFCSKKVSVEKPSKEMYIEIESLKKENYPWSAELTVCHETYSEYIYSSYCIKKGSSKELLSAVRRIWLSKLVKETDKLVEITEYY